MAQRYREKIKMDPQIGTYFSASGLWTYYNPDIVNLEAQSWDFLSPAGSREGHPLTLLRVTNDPMRFSGTMGNSDVLTNFRPDNWAPGLALYGIPDASGSAIKAMNRSNPNRPTVDVPLFAYELRDLPTMAEDTGNLAIFAAKARKRRPHFRDTYHLAKGNLTYQFGWAPFMGDLLKLLNLQEAFRRRFSELNRLASPRGLKRRIQIMDSVDGGPLKGIPTGNALGTVTWNYSSRHKVWSVIRWKLSGNAKLPVSDERLMIAARAAVLGLAGPDLETAWNAIPFSWLADYFSNVGEVLGASRNAIPVEPTEIWVMTNSSLTATASDFAGENLQMKGGVHIRTRKVRELVTPNLSFQPEWPCLSGQQWSTLYSLGFLQLFN